MYLKYGNYSHSTGECVINIQKQSIMSEDGYKVGWVENWEIAGMLMADSPALLTEKIRELETAYGSNGKDLKLLNDDGTETAHKLISNLSRTGVIISRLDYPIGQGAEYTTFRSYAISASCAYAFAETGGGGGGGGGGGRGNGQNIGALLTFSETISVVGTGGPRVIALETRDGDVVLQQVSKSTPVYTTQSGTATGYFGYPAVPAPIGAGTELEDRRMIQRESPTTVSQLGKETQFRVSWSYQFVS